VQYWESSVFFREGESKQRLQTEQKDIAWYTKYDKIYLFIFFFENIPGLCLVFLKGVSFRVKWSEAGLRAQNTKEQTNTRTQQRQQTIKQPNKY